MNSFWVPLYFRLFSDFNLSTNIPRIPINILILPHIFSIPKICTSISVRKAYHFRFQIYLCSSNFFNPILSFHESHSCIFFILKSSTQSYFGLIRLTAEKMFHHVLLTYMQMKTSNRWNSRISTEYFEEDS